LIKQHTGEYKSRDNISIIKNWIAREIVYNKRVLRLRAYLYLKIHWIETANIWNTLLFDNHYCTIPRNNQWITLRSNLDSSGELLPKPKEEFDKKLHVFEEWARITQPSSYNAQEIYKIAFEEDNYTVEANKLYTDKTGVTIQIDLLCIKDDWKLGVQVKNITSEVFHNPYLTRYFSIAYSDLERQFAYCHRNGIISILIAPFINNSFYDFVEGYQGLYCQTLLQIVNPEYSEISNAVKKTLRFGNILATDTAPDNVKSWIGKIPKIWLEHYNPKQ
jgi:hypothetical protein